MDRVLFLVFGLNRSGTSVLAGSLLRCGVCLDFEAEGLEATSHKVDPTRPDKGYESYEVPAVLEFTRGVAARSGGHQNNPVLPEELQFSTVDAVTVTSLVDLAPRFPFAIKDPLLTFQYRHWKDAIRGHRPDLSVIPLISLRHPLEQAHALMKRGFCRSVRSGLDLWLRYYAEVRSLIRNGESPKIVVYDGIEDSFSEQIEALCRDSRLDYAEESVRNFFRPGSGHRFQSQELDQHPMGTAIDQLYRDLEARRLR